MRLLKKKEKQLKETRRRQQEQNVARKKREKEEHKARCLAGMKKEKNKDEEEEDEREVEEEDDEREDAEWFRKEVGEEPDPGERTLGRKSEDEAIDCDVSGGFSPRFVSSKESQTGKEKGKRSAAEVRQEQIWQAQGWWHSEGQEDKTEIAAFSPFYYYFCHYARRLKHTWKHFLAKNMNSPGNCYDLETCQQSS